MSDEKRFPPPGNEVGYREAALPSSMPVTAPIGAHDGKKHVLATLAEDPDVALANASNASWEAHRVKRKERKATRRRATVVVLVLVLVLVPLLLGSAYVATSILRARNDERLIEAKRNLDLARSKKRVTTKDGAVRGLDMGDDWPWAEDRRSDVDFTVTELKWHHSTLSGDVFLYAKDYAVSEDETIASLTGRDWRAYYAPALSSIRTLDVEAITFGGRRAVEVTAEGTASLRTFSIHEVYIPITKHVLLTSAMGPSTVIHAFDSRIATWRRTVDFAALH